MILYSNRVIKINAREIDPNVIYNLEKQIKILPTQESIAIDLIEVEIIGNYFIEFLNKFSKLYSICLINLQSCVFSLINLTGMDRVVKIYLNANDFKKDVRRLVNRRFKVIK